MRNARQRHRAVGKRAKELHGFEKDTPGGLIKIVGLHLFEDEVECPDGIALDVIHGETAVRLLLKIDDCLLIEYAIQEARKAHPVFFD